MIEIAITPRFEETVEDDVLVKQSYCQNCGQLVTSRRFRDGMTPKEAHEAAAQDGALFLLHLDTHYPKTGPDA